MKRTFVFVRIVFGAFALLGVLAFGSLHTASAAPQDEHRITVNGAGDSNTADSVITLREALLIARDGTNNGNGLGRPLTDAEVYQLYNCQVTGYEPDHWWIDSSCGANVAETIYFYLPNCPCTFAPTTPLPFVASYTTIDGYTGQPGATENTSKKGMNANIMIRLYGGNMGNAYGLDIGYQVTIKGLEIYGFNGAGIHASSGLDTITGSVIDGNTGNGIELYAPTNHVGALALAGRNAIYQNGGHGVEVFGGSAANQIVNNLIGVPVDSDKGSGNQLSGVSIHGSSNYMASNVIAYNGENGIVVDTGIQNNFYNNSFHDNYKLGIDLGNDGVTANDGKNQDSDTGANNLQNYPSLSSAPSSTRYIKGKLVSKPNTTYQIDIFKSGHCDANGFGEGKKRIGSFTIVTDANGVAKIGSTVKKFKAGNAITAVASGSEGTSEFSKCVMAQ